MSRYKEIPFRDPQGIEGTVLTVSRFLDNDREKLLRLRDGTEIFIPGELLSSNQDGTYRLSVPVGEIVRNSVPQHKRENFVDSSRGETTVVPAIEEHLHVDARPVETGRVLIHKHVESSEAVVDEPLMHESWNVERVPVNRIVESPVESRYEGDTLILPVLEEVLVVEKRLVLREELRVTRNRQQIREPQTHTVRRERLEVERVP